MFSYNDVVLTILIILAIFNTFFQAIIFLRVVDLTKRGIGKSDIVVDSKGNCSHNKAEATAKPMLKEW